MFKSVFAARPRRPRPGDPCCGHRPPRATRCIISMHQMMVMVNGRMAPLFVMVNGQMVPVYSPVMSANGELKPSRS